MPHSRDQLSLDMAYRYSDYDDLTTDTYKIGMDWAPIEDIRFRGSFQRAVRAANVIELFTAQGFNLFDDGARRDPCGPAQTATLQQCLDTGVPDANFYGNSLLDSPAGQYSFLQGGNPDLMPEESDTYTYGIILQPRFLPKLAMSIDYFDIEITDAVSTFGPRNTLTACYENNDPLACDQHQPRPGDRSRCGSAMATSGPQHQHRWLRDQGLGPEPDVRRSRDGPVRRAQLQPDGHLPR